MKTDRPKIVIVGGGAGGLELATTLGHRLGKKKKADIILVDKNLTHLWKPLLHEVAAGTIDSNEDEINYMIHAHKHYFRYQLGEMFGLDRKKQNIEIKISGDKNSDTLFEKIHYDILVIAVGSVSNNYAIPGTDKFCFYLDTRQEADFFQREFIRELMRIQYFSSEDKMNELDTAIVGGGATGVELAAELRYSLGAAARYGLEKFSKQKKIKFTIIEASDRILSALPKRISDVTKKELDKLDIDTVTGEKVIKITDEGIHTASNHFIPARIKVWAAGIKAPQFLANLDGLETNRINQLKVKKTLQTTVDDKIFAMGDCSACLREDGKSYVPARAQAAHQQASLLARSIKKILINKSPQNYHYKDYGSLISLSRHDTVGQLMGRVGRVMIEGKLARLVYLSLYKMHQVKLFGWWRVILMTIARGLTRGIKPKLKLH